MTDEFISPEPAPMAAPETFSEPVLDSPEATHFEAPIENPEPLNVPDRFLNEDGTPNIDALLASHNELESALTPDDGLNDFMIRGEGTDIDITDEDWGNMRFAFNQLPEDFQANSVVQSAFEQFANTGMVTEEMLNELTRSAGVSRGEAINYIDEAQFIYSGEYARYTSELVGSPEAYERMISWAKENLSMEQILQYNRLMGASEQMQKDAVQALWDTYTSNSPEMLLSQNFSITPPQPETGPFTSEAEVIAAIQDPRYKTDQAYRQWVASRM